MYRMEIETGNRDWKQRLKFLKGNGDWKCRLEMYRLEIQMGELQTGKCRQELDRLENRKMRK